jgi:signal transduction histidine kinase
MGRVAAEEAPPFVLAEPFGAWRSMLAERAGAIGDVIHRVGLTANSPLEIREVLGRLASLALEAVPADRCAVFMLDPSGTKLVPTLAIAHERDNPMWERFRHLEPIDLQEDPIRWQAFSAGRAMAIPDVRGTTIIPDAFSEEFGVGSLVLMPLMANGEAQGLLSLDWREPGHEASEEEISLVEALGGYAGLAVRNARLYDRLEAKARTLERVVEVAGAANSAASLRSVLELVCSAFDELLGTSHCSVNLVKGPDPADLQTVAVSGAPWFTSQPEKSIKAVSPAEIERVRELWQRSPQPVVFPSALEQTAVDPACVPDTIRSAAFFPLWSPDAPLGFIAAGFPEEGDLPVEHLETGQALADLAATAASRAALNEEINNRLQRAEVLSRLSDVVAGTAELAPALRRLNRALQPTLGVRLVSLAVADRHLRETLGALAPTKADLEAIRSWRAKLSAGSHDSLRPRRTADGFLVPVAHKRRVIGALSVEVEAEHSTTVDEDLLLAVGGGCAEVVHKACLRRELAESERRQAILAERERIARDLHDCVGQLLTGMGLRLSELCSESVDDELRGRLDELTAMAITGSRQIREAIHSLLFLQVRQQGLVRALRELTRTFQATTGIQVGFRVSGDAKPLANPVEDAVYRVALEALRNVERHSGAISATVVLAYGPERVFISVTDDGCGLGDFDIEEDHPGHFGLVGLRDLLTDLGGELVLTDLAPHGLRTEGVVPVRRMRRAGQAHEQASAGRSGR